MNGVEWGGGVAIVDDERSIVQIYREILEAMSIPIAFVAFDGEDAINKFKESKKKPQVVLMDYRMPVMNGIQASISMLRIDPSVKIIFISADGSVRDEAMKAGAATFIQKPASLKDIVIEVVNVAKMPPHFTS
ncbi:MAG TPA: response regulator [Methanocella sp.]|nr:response regulator [Methanocella sp.]